MRILETENRKTQGIGTGTRSGCSPIRNICGTASLSVKLYFFEAETGCGTSSCSAAYLCLADVAGAGLSERFTSLRRR